jgi:hypothetical protein
MISENASFLKNGGAGEKNGGLFWNIVFCLCDFF